jgi:hypothetical protein
MSFARAVIYLFSLCVLASAFIQFAAWAFGSTPLIARMISFVTGFLIGRHVAKRLYG